MSWIVTRHGFGAVRILVVASLFAAGCEGGLDTAQEPAPTPKYRIHGTPSRFVRPALWVVDGVITHDNELRTLKPEDIASILRLQGDAARAKYGVTGDTVVLEIKTRR